MCSGHLLISSSDREEEIVTVSVLYRAHPCTKCSLDISSVLEYVSSLSRFVSLLSLHCSFEKAFLSLLFSVTLHSTGYTFPFLPCFLLLFFPQLYVKLPQTTTWASGISFSLEWFLCLLYNVTNLCLPHLVA